MGGGWGDRFFSLDKTYFEKAGFFKNKTKKQTNPLSKSSLHERSEPSLADNFDINYILILIQ